MKYISIDIETGGLGPNAALLEIGAIYDDGESDINDLPTFRGVFIPDEKGRFNGEFESGALAMHIKSGLINAVIGYSETDVEHRNFTDFITSHPNLMWDRYSRWVEEHCEGCRNYAGKNAAGFDLPFLNRFGFGEVIRPKHRVLDVGALYAPLAAARGRSWIPNLTECLEIADIRNEYVTHRAVDDCRAVVAAVRHVLNRGSK